MRLTRNGISKNVLNAKKAVLLRLPFQGGRATGGGQPAGLAAAPKKAFITPNRIISVRLYKVQPHDQEHRFMKIA